ncbi:hypothetical protein Osc7112_3727 [Oscillatoria nigro-viridis PCC 7112]|uniref:Uncharacterized protein n=1 Tax=Phormidium nigroviride PCC 7112 TaxID=179408 RepID=K9VLJ9_9CYAN|nr:hypothetical protein Osc7112_3727 [Oscillatoria nigro-viridis PCC 7112]
MQIIPAPQKPMALGFPTEEIAQLVTLNFYRRWHSWEFLPQMVADRRRLTQINVD